jgi:hypothetical protein
VQVQPRVFSLLKPRAACRAGRAQRKISLGSARRDRGAIRSRIKRVRRTASSTMRGSFLSPRGCEREYTRPAAAPSSRGDSYQSISQSDCCAPSMSPARFDRQRYRTSRKGEGRGAAFVSSKMKAPTTAAGAFGSGNAGGEGGLQLVEAGCDGPQAAGAARL